MGFQSKTYSLSDEVIAAIEAGRKRDGSPNKFLRRVLTPMSDGELALAKKIGEQMSGKILCPRECVQGQDLSVFGDFEDQLFCPHCEMEVTIAVKEN